MDNDNMIKPIQDALNGLVYVDDSQITDTAVRKTDIGGAFRVRGASIVLLGVITGLLCIIPIVGFVGWPLAILAKSVDGGGWMDVVVWPSVVYGIVQSIETWVLTPLVQGRSMNISPFTVLFAIIVGGSVGGFFGVLLAVPLANCVAIVYSEEIQPRLDEWSKSGTETG